MNTFNFVNSAEYLKLGSRNGDAVAFAHIEQLFTVVTSTRCLDSIDVDHFLHNCFCLQM